MQFEVRALSPDNRLHSVLIEAADTLAARKAVEAKHLRIVSIKARRGVASARSGRGAFSLVMFSQELLALLEAGLSLVEALEGLIEKESAPVPRAVMEALNVRIREGAKLSDAVAAQPEHFPALFAGIVRAAERTSDLPQALRRYIDYQTRLDAVRSRIISATIYPAVLFVVGGLVGIFLMTYVVPKFAAVYADSGREMPWMSRLLMRWGELLGNHTLLVIGAMLVLIVAAIATVRRFSREGRWSQFARRIPGISQRARILELSRLYLTMGMLLEGGIPVVMTLDMVESAVSAETRLKLRRARAEISNGEPVSRAFELHDLSTPIALRMLRVGERSGQLGTMLMRSAQFYEGESARWIENFSKIFEPAMMAIIGGVIGVIIVLLYMPIFDLAGSLQ
ncbi:MAG: type II secretion system protein [Candidatus Dactylopiibacterium carminicum]|uniref:Type II secretion system F family protein n=1 Tax=Candidatus Dactylopiibacterium carminicum TaxID=857335 RepID=A0A272ER40_9RHOO|nr:type II secretion system F family protein [Candidatus Dactylopiibacterium carminicum]KAF7598751.1 type II secretion system F family protein [Candidatus Dactylopiibacterium carminicum]PAS92589.1 MAG: type II secretion system protein [Candidatus Dactylopiibacterium carminicum]PAS93889.1 MAG: type II secretion system protein [Candidatus Dactylopiibacterium carminicum]PAS98772.1 MAG: type II secretion system protein [Candidatus Dactylopiibacterium carminicum]